MIFGDIFIQGEMQVCNVFEKIGGEEEDMKCLQILGNMKTGVEK
jgi:hypothetical protein